MSRFRFTCGPWNVNEGVEAFGPGVRPTVDLEEKFKKFGFNEKRCVIASAIL